VSKFADDAEVPSFAKKVVCAKCGARGRHIDVRPNWKEQPPHESLTGNELAGLRVQRTELKTVDQFDAMSDEELRQYVEGKS
jgi:hypothetical protein